MSLPDLPEPSPNPKASYGLVKLNYVANLWDLMSTPLSSQPISSKYPLTFESLDQAHGYILYCTVIKGHFPDPSLLELKGLADRAYVYLDKVTHLALFNYVDVITGAYLLAFHRSAIPLWRTVLHSNSGIKRSSSLYLG